MATKKIAQTVITEDKFYTIAAANALLYITTVHEICRSNQRRISVFSHC